MSDSPSKAVFPLALLTPVFLLAGGCSLVSSLPFGSGEPSPPPAPASSEAVGGDGEGADGSGTGSDVGAVPEVVFAAGEERFLRGDWEEAARHFDAYLSAPGPTPREPEALWRLAVLHGTGDGEWGEPERSLEYLEHLASDFPGDPHGVQAAWVLELREDLQSALAALEARDREIRRLNEALEEIKRIDLERRPPPEDSLPSGPGG